MDKPLVDPLALVGYLLADFDGSECMVAEIRRVMSRYLIALKADHPVRKRIDVFLADLEVLAYVLSSGVDLRPKSPPLLCGVRWFFAMSSLRHSGI